MLRITRLLKSFKYAFKGLIKTFQEEQNLQIQSIMALLAIGAGFWFDICSSSWILLLLVIFLVILMELVNSVVERITDVLEPKISKYAKEIKDIMAGAVFLASILSIIVGILIFWPYFG